jgi:transcription elongation factor Elf1
MNINKKKITIPTLKFNSNYFKCPRCGWQYPGPLLIKGDIAPNTQCQNCGNSYLVRVE